MLRSFSHPVACCMSRVVGSCWVRFETGQTFNYLQTDATSPNIIGPTMLGVLAFVLVVARKRCNNSEQCWELLRPFARSFSKTEYKEKKVFEENSIIRTKITFCRLFWNCIVLSHAQISATLDPGQPHSQANSCYSSDWRRLGNERKFSQQAWQVTSHSNSQTTTGNEAGFLRCLIPIFRWLPNPFQKKELSCD